MESRKPPVIEDTPIGEVMYCPDGFIFFGPQFRYGFAPEFSAFLFEKKELWFFTKVMARINGIIFDHMIRGLMSGPPQEFILRKLDENKTNIGGDDYDDEEGSEE